MSRFFALLLLFLLTCSAMSHAHEGAVDELKEQARSWAAERLAVHPSQIQFGELDRRARIPDCPQDRDFDFPFSSQSTLRATCPGTDWQIFLRLETREAEPVLVAARDLEAGSVLGAEDLKVVSRVDGGERALTALHEAIGRSLRRAVMAEQPIRRSALEDTLRVLRTQTELSAGTPLEGKLDVVTLTEPQAPPAAVLEGEITEHSQAARDLPAGRILLGDDVLTLEPALVAASTLISGTRLTSDRVRLDRIDARSLPRDALRSKEAIRDAELVRTLLAGQLIRRGDLRPARLVRRGELVEVLHTRGALSINSTAEATQDGRFGEMITLIHPRSGRELRAEVIGPGQVRIHAGSP